MITATSDYSLTDILKSIYHSQLVLEAAIMELTLLVEAQGAMETGGSVRGTLEAIGDNAGFINHGLARLKKLDID